MEHNGENIDWAALDEVSLSILGEISPEAHKKSQTGLENMFTAMHLRPFRSDLFRLVAMWVINI